MGKVMSFCSEEENGITKYSYKTEDSVTFDQFLIEVEKDFQVADRQKTRSVFKQLDHHIWRNPENERVKNVQCIVEEFIQKIVDGLQKRDSRVKFSIVKSGSFYEGLRIGQPYEFDYMLLVENQTVRNVGKVSDFEFNVYSDTQVFYMPKIDKDGISFHPTYRNFPLDAVFRDVSKMSEIVFAKDVETSHKEVDSFAIRHLVYRQIPRVLKEFPDSYKGLKIVDNSPQTNHTKPNYCLHLEYMGDGIMVDLVPCLKYPQDCLSILPVIPQKVCDFISSIVPGLNDDVANFATSRLYLVCNRDKWRLSYSVLEQALLRSLPNETKAALRLLKYLDNMFITIDQPNPSDVDIYYLSKYGYDSYINSYGLKCLFLNTVMDLYKTPEELTDAYMIFVKMLHRFVLCRNKLDLSTPLHLVIQSRSVFFMNTSKSNFTVLSEENCHDILKLFGTLLSRASIHWDDSIFPLINYPSIDGVKKLPSYLKGV